MRPEVSVSRPAMQRSTVVLPAPEGPNRMVIDAASEIRTEAWTRGPPLNCLPMSAISSKEPPLSIESINDGKNNERNDQQHRRRQSSRRIVEALHLVVDVDRESPCYAGNVTADHQNDSELSHGVREAQHQSRQNT